MPEYEKYYYAISGSVEKWSRPEEKDTLARINAAVPNNGSMLEIGCGAAAVVPFLRSDIHYTGIDVSVYALEQAKAHVKATDAVLLSPAEQLPFPDHAFDFILALASLEHVSNPRLVFSEMLRVLKDHGMIYIKGPNFDWPLSTPNAIRHRSWCYRQWFRVKSVGLFFARLVGYYSFRIVEPNYTEATGRYEKPDDDLRHVMSTDEMVGFFRRTGFRIDFLCPLPKDTPRIKKLMTFLPGLHYFGQGMDVMLRR